MRDALPELSIIVPVRDDDHELSGLLADLARQEWQRFELLVCGTAPRGPVSPPAGGRFPVSTVTSAPGRGAQMNAGAAAAAGELLLFLHADSRFSRHDALQSGVRAFRQQRPLAARFALSFRRSDPSPSLAYFYHEAKARLDGPDCIRGDQGILMERRNFERCGCFDATLPYLEDVRLAKRVAQAGEWLLLPAVISTSARRFEQEGFRCRQTASAVIINAEETGWNELLTALPGLYRLGPSVRLDLTLILGSVSRLIAARDRAWRRSFWRATGRHVAANAWQLFFWLDARRTFTAGGTADQVEPRLLRCYERRLKRLFSSRAAGWCASLLTRIWLRLMIVSGWLRGTSRTG